MIFKEPNKEAVLVDHAGNEIDWWDPLYSLEENEDEWIVRIFTNDYVYNIPKEPGLTLKVRDLPE